MCGHLGVGLRLHHAGISLALLLLLFLRWCGVLGFSYPFFPFVGVRVWRLGELIIYIGGLRIDVNYLCLCPAGIALALLLLLFLCWCGVLGFVCNWSVLEIYTTTIHSIDDIFMLLIV